jgi:hypothetical protein
MSAIKTKYSPSINILRDNDNVLNYIPTKNANQAFNNIIIDSNSGIKSHVLIGAYGTGKSSFLLALKQSLDRSFIHFNDSKKLLNTIPKYEFISVVGNYTSFENFFANYFELGEKYSSNDIIKALDKEYKKANKKGLGLAIIVDEFGKFLEFSAKNSPESELYFIQQLSEWANNVNNDTLFITTLHQDFSAYSLELNKQQRQEWDKVKGRIKDVPFNEPVEQLLFLASERINQKFKNKLIEKNFTKLFECIESAKAFPLKDYFEIEFAKKLYPFDILSASILTLALQRYGQNERSLFSFIESNDHLGINEFDYKEKGYYSVPRVYDYLLNGYYSFLTTKYNPHYANWASIRRALERIEGIFLDNDSQKEAEDIIKLIGLLNLFANSSAKLEPKFYSNYARYSLGIKNPENILSQLQNRKIIRYVNHSFRYILSEGTDLDIEIAIDDAGRLVEKITNVVNHLTPYFDFPFISAKSVYFTKGTPRFFQFKLTESPINTVPEGDIDGFINLVFTEDTKSEKIIEEASHNCKEAILFGYYKNTSGLKNLLFEIHKVKKVIDININDRVAVKELQSILDHYVNLLNHYVLDNLYSDNGNVIWYFNGAKLKIKNRQQFNQQLSLICEQVYYNTPIYKNELVNKTKVSTQVSIARKKLLTRLSININQEDLGFTNSEFPPEKSIYLTLLKNTKFHTVSDGLGSLKQPSESSFKDLWETCIKFLNSTKNKERKISELITILSTRPFKLKQGFIDYWVPIFLLSKSDEFALYDSTNYIPQISDDVLDLINRRPGLFSIKAFDVVGVKLELFNRYRIFLNQSESSKPNNKIFIQTIKPFLGFYRDLPDYAKKTNRLDKKTISLRSVIAKAKDPEKAFFEDFPNALGYSIIDLQKKDELADKYITQLQDSIREIRGAYDTLIDRFEKYFINEIIGSKETFPHNRDFVINRYKGLKTHLLLPHQKTFFTRIQSAIDDRKSWLSSIAQSCIGKSLVSINDEEEVLLFEKLKDIIYELDNLSEISKEQINEKTEEVIKLEMTSFDTGINKNILRIPKEKTKEINKQILSLKSILGKDKKVNIATLAKLLQELLQND